MATCSVDGCENPVKARGWCRAHYMRWYQYGTLELTRPRIEWCTVEGCEREADRVTVGLCEAHYYQIRRNGEIKSAVVAARPRKPKAPKPERKPRPRRTECKVPGCANPPPIYRGWCRSHYRRWQRHGDPLTTVPQNERNWPTREANISWKGDEVGYGAAHQRVVRLRGAARSHPCARCGDPADHWSYDHADPDERLDSDDGPFSANPDHYAPLCVRCHKRFDMDYLARMRPALLCTECRRKVAIGLPSCPACGADSRARRAAELHAGGCAITAIAAVMSLRPATVSRWLKLWPAGSAAA